MSKNFMDITGREFAQAKLYCYLASISLFRRFGIAPGNLLPVIRCILTDART